MRFNTLSESLFKLLIEPGRVKHTKFCEEGPLVQPDPRKVCPSELLQYLAVCHELPLHSEPQLVNKAAPLPLGAWQQSRLQQSELAESHHYHIVEHI